MWTPLPSGSWTSSPALAGRFFTTESPGKSSSGLSCLEFSVLPIPGDLWGRLDKFSAIISSNTLSTPFSFLLPPRGRKHVKQILGCLMLSLRPLKLSSFLKIHFWFPPSARGISIILSSTSHIHSSELPNLLLISCSVFLSVIAFFSSDQSLFIFSSSFVKILAKFSLCSSILQFN